MTRSLYLPLHGHLAGAECTQSKDQIDHRLVLGSLTVDMDTTRTSSSRRACDGTGVSGRSYGTVIHLGTKEAAE